MENKYDRFFESVKDFVLKTHLAYPEDLIGLKDWKIQTLAKEHNVSFPESLYSYYTFFGSLGSVLALNIDTFMIGEFLNFSDVAVYNMSLNLVKMIMVPALGVYTISSPKIAVFIENNDIIQLNNMYKKTSLYLFIVGALLFSLIAVGLDDLFSFQSKVIFGSAILRSMVHHTQPYLLSVLSEVDLNRSEGGTRDTMRLWPFAQRNVNINPDLFLSTEKGSIETKPPRQVREKEVDRPVLFMVFADLLALKPIDKERLISKVNAKIEEEDIPLAAFVIDGDSILTAFEFETSAIEMVRLLLELMKEAGDGLALKIILHAGPVYRNEKGIEGRDTKPLREISRFSPRAAICASGNMAAVLALNPEKFEMEYGGFVSSADGKSKHTVYKVTIKK